MSAKELLSKLMPSARRKLDLLMRKRRQTVWDQEQVVLRIRDYPKSKEQTVGVVLPNLHGVRLWSETLRRMVPLTMTQATIRRIEDMGGLDAYLLNTPHAHLKSDTASAVRWEIECTRRKLTLLQQLKEEQQRQALQPPQQRQ